MTIRQAQANDVSFLCELARKTYVDAFGHTFTEPDLAAHLQKNLSPEAVARMIAKSVVLLAEVEGSIVGYTQFGPMDADTLNGDYELRRLYVLAEFQNQGIGGALLEAALNHPDTQRAPAVYLDVWEHNHAAQRFYQRYGFETVGTRTFEVESGAPTSLDRIMVRRLPP